MDLGLTTIERLAAAGLGAQLSLHDNAPCTDGLEKQGIPWPAGVALTGGVLSVVPGMLAGSAWHTLSTDARMGKKSREFRERLMAMKYYADTAAAVEEELARQKARLPVSDDVKERKN